MEKVDSKSRLDVSCASASGNYSVGYELKPGTELTPKNAARVSRRVRDCVSVGRAYIVRIYDREAVEERLLNEGNFLVRRVQSAWSNFLGRFITYMHCVTTLLTVS